MTVSVVTTPKPKRQRISASSPTSQARPRMPVENRGGYDNRPEYKPKQRITFNIADFDPITSLDTLKSMSGYLEELKRCVDNNDEIRFKHVLEMLQIEERSAKYVLMKNDEYNKYSKLGIYISKKYEGLTKAKEPNINIFVREISKCISHIDTALLTCLKHKDKEEKDEFFGKAPVGLVNRLQKIASDELIAAGKKEIKYLVSLGNVQKLTDFMSTKTEAQKSQFANHILKEFNDKNLEENKVNRFLDILGGIKIIEVPEEAINISVSAVIRGDFEGGIYKLEENRVGKRGLEDYSQAYKKYKSQIDSGRKPTKKQNYEYDLQSAPAWQACMQDQKFARLEGALKEALNNHQILPEDVVSANVYDFAHLLIASNKETSRAKEGEVISFNKLYEAYGIEGNFSEKDLAGTKKKFIKEEFLPDQQSKEEFAQILKAKGIDDAYTSYLIENINKKGILHPNYKKDGLEFNPPIPRFSVHHISAVKDAHQYGKDNFLQTNKGGFVVFMTMPGEEDLHDLFHVVDKYSALGVVGERKKDYRMIPANGSKFIAGFSPNLQMKGKEYPKQPILTKETERE